jgi:ATP-binding cassette, subfamily B, bacterial PglK
MFDKISTVLSINDKRKFYILFFIIILVIFIEMIGISLIPLYVILVSDPSTFISKIPLENLRIYLNDYNANTFIIYSTICLFIIFLFKNLLLGLFVYIQGKIIIQFNKLTSGFLFNHYISSNYLFYVNTNPSQITRILDTDIGLTFNLIQTILKLIREALVVISILALMLIVNFKLYFTTFLFFLIFLGIFYYLFKDKLKSKGKKYQDESSKIIKIINQSFNSLKEIKISKSEGFFSNIFNLCVEKRQNLSFFNHLMSTLPRLFLEIFAIGIITLFTLSFFYFHYPISTFIPLLSLMAVACVRFIPAFNNIVSSINTIKFYSPSLDVISDAILNSQKVKSYKDKIISNKNFLFNKRIEFKDVSYKYDRQKENVLNDIDLTIDKGGIYAFSGESGSGKTTLINLLLGFLDPDKGKISIDEFELSKNVNLWQTKIGYIPQNVYLLDESLKENIAFGVNEKDYDQAKLDKAISQSRLDKFVSTLPNGIETNLGNMGNKISGGQKQRIGIARALYRDPEILIFDEATNSLDKEVEKEIFEDVYNNKGSKTIIIISHQKFFYDKCDEVFKLKNGKLVK